MIQWPTELPNIQYPDDALQRVRQSQALRTNMDAGPAKKRRRFTAGAVRLKPWVIRMTKAQVERLRTFYFDELQVVQPFEWIDHVTRAPATYRFVSPPAEKAAGPNMWDVTIELEQLP